MTATLLTGPDQKEGLSLAYVKALAARAGFATAVPVPDRDSEVLGQQTVTVRIPKDNVLDVATLQTLMERSRSGDI